MISVTTILSIQTPITVYAATSVEVEAEYSDGVVGPSSDTKWYSTCARGAGYKGQGVLIYLLERNGGGAVAGTSPKAFPCSAEVKGYELHAQDKYNRYTEVTTWENALPYWGGANNGGIMRGSVYSNTEAIKSWLKTSYDGTSTNGIEMVATIWGADIARRFTNEELILIIEPIVAIQYSQYIPTSLLELNSNMSIQTMVDRLKLFNYFVNESGMYDTAMSADLLDLVTIALNGYDRDEVIYAMEPMYTSLKNALYNMISSRDINTYIYKKLGDPVAGTSKELIEYYGTLSPEYAGWSKAESGRLYYRRSAQRAAYVTSATRICNNANFDLWPAGTSANQVHNDANINSKSIGMLAMLAFSGDDSQTTCDEPLLPTPHPAPQESTGT